MNSVNESLFEELDKTQSMYKINPTTEDIPVTILVSDIDKGYKLQNLNDNEINSNFFIELSRSIVLTPDYQREYRFTLNDESRLIESVLLGIPIPPIFLATSTYKGVRIFNVVDGQHRLRALYRFRSNKFKLEGLTLLNRLNGFTFDDLSTALKTEFLDFTLQTIIFKDVPGIEFELEIFNRYNKGTKPLSDQEIRHAVYNSNFNQFINNFIYELYQTKNPEDLYIAYNITKSRVQKKKIQEELFTILSILEYGINIKYTNSPEYANAYMEEKYNYFKSNKMNCENNLKNMIELFEKFNNLIKELRKIVDFPFSKELHGVSSRNYKFQISTGMLLSGIYYELYNKNQSKIDIILSDNKKRNEFHQILVENIKVSYLEDASYKSSSTDSKKMYKLVNKITNEIIKKL